MGQNGLHAQLHGLSAGDGHHVHPEGHLQVGIFIQRVQQLLRVGVLAHLDNGPHARAVGFVANIINAGKQSLFLLGNLEDFLQHGGFVHLIGNFGNDDKLAAGAAVLQMEPGTHLQFAPAGFVGLKKLPVRRQNAAGGEVRALEKLHQPPGVDGRPVDEGRRRVDGFAQVVGGNVGGQAHGNAAGAVYQQIGKPGGQKIRLLLGVVKIQVEAHGVLVDVPQKLGGQFGHAGLGISHGGGTVAVDGAKVAVAVHQGGAHDEGLGHAGQRVVYGRIPMWVVFAQAVAHDAGAFPVGLVGGVAQFVHGKQNAPLHGLQAVLHSGQGPLQNDMLRIGNHGIMEHVLHVFYDDFLVELYFIVSFFRHVTSPVRLRARNGPLC